MHQLAFHPRIFFRTVLFFLIATAIWSVAVTHYDEFTKNDKGLVTGLGFLTLMAASIIFGSGRLHLAKLVFLPIGVILIFLFGSFILLPLMMTITETEWAYNVCNGLFVAVTMTFLIDRWDIVRFRKLTIALTWLCMIIAYVIMDRFGKSWIWQYDILPRVALFVLFNTMMIIPLALGMALGRKEE